MAAPMGEIQARIVAYGIANPSLSYGEIETALGLCGNQVAVSIGRLRKGNRLDPAWDRVRGAYAKQAGLAPPPPPLTRRMPLAAKKQLPQNLIGKTREIIDRHTAYLLSEDLDSKEYTVVLQNFRGLVQDFAFVEAVEAVEKVEEASNSALRDLLLGGSSEE